jgi:hypothetical protein
MIGGFALFGFDLFGLTQPASGQREGEDGEAQGGADGQPDPDGDASDSDSSSPAISSSGACIRSTNPTCSSRGN